MEEEKVLVERKRKAAEPVSETPEETFNVEDEMGPLLRKWLNEFPPENLSVAQMSSHLVKQLAKSGDEFGEYLKWCLEPTEPRERKVRNLFPLPLWHDDVYQLHRALQEEDSGVPGKKKREEGQTRSQAQKGQRLDGLKTWHALVIVGLNFMSGARRRPEKGPPPGSAATAAQEEALTKVWDFLKVFLDEKDKGGVPRTPTFNWSQELGELRVSYTGEVVEKAQGLTLKQVLPGLPSPEHGALVNLVELLPKDLEESLNHPERLVKKVFDGPMPKPRVLAEPGEWPLIAKAMYDRGLAIPVESIPSVGGTCVMNGAFGVVKQGKKLESGEDVLRLIMDLRGSNWLLEQLNGDTGLLTGAPTFQRILVEEGQELLVSGEDLTSAFYLFRLPPGWENYMVIGKPLKASDLGFEGSQEVHLGLQVLPMGWHSSVGLMQAAHRRIALSSPFQGGAGLLLGAEINRRAEFPDLDEGPAWSIYLDDTTLIEKVETQVAESLKGLPSEDQMKLRKAYAWWGIPTNPGKALERAQEAERLGAVLDGKRGLLRTSTRRALELMSLGSWIRGQEEVDRKTLQIYAGKAVHILQFRRCLFSVMEEIFTSIASSGVRCPITPKLRNELLLLECLLPMAQFNLRASVDPIVTVSDASETGGGMCFASRLSRAGEEEALKLLEGQTKPERDAVDPTRLAHEERVLVIDLFSGIGGLTLALKKAGIDWHRVTFVEKDKDCRRLLRRTYQGAEFVNDIESIDEKALKKMVDGCPGITGIVVGGGSPCQGLSKLKAGRKHLQDDRSKLFFEACRVFELVEKIGAALKIWVLKLLENVVPDVEDIKAMTRETGMRPVLVDAQHLSRARRPRLFWISVHLVPVEEVEMFEKEHFDVVNYKADPEPLVVFLEEGCDWPGGLRDRSLKFPTFTRSIPRSRPPPDPVGLAQADAGARARWESEGFRYPPYTYHDDFMILSKECELRPLVANERELLMGFKKGHTLKLLRKPPETAEEVQQAEHLRCSALGNSFHTNAVACLLDHAFMSMGLKKRKGAKEIVASSLARQATSQAEPIMNSTSDAEGDQPGEPDDDAKSVQGNLGLEHLSRKAISTGLVGDTLFPPEKLPKAVVAAFIRRQEFRGSDVRLDIGSLYRPDSVPRGSVEPGRWIWHVATSYPFKTKEHINVLELRTIVHTFEWRTRKANYGNCRSLHLSDSQVSLAVCVKGRSSSRALNRLLRRLCAVQVATGVYPIYSWIESFENPADEPSRRYEPQA